MWTGREQWCRWKLWWRRRDSISGESRDRRERKRGELSVKEDESAASIAGFLHRNRNEKQRSVERPEKNPEGIGRKWETVRPTGVKSDRENNRLNFTHHPNTQTRISRKWVFLFRPLPYIQTCPKCYSIILIWVMRQTLYPSFPLTIISLFCHKV